MRFKLSALAVLSLFAQSAFGFEPFTIQNIRIEGAERTEAGTIYNYLPVHVGEKFDSLRAQQGITALFATGFFSDVRLDVDGADVVVVVKERPIISKLSFAGIKDIPEEQLRKSLKVLGLAEARFFDQSLLDGARQELLQQYHSRGKYSAVVIAKTSLLGNGKLDVLLDVSEGLPAKINAINVKGNEYYSDKKLLSKISLCEEKWWKFFSSCDQYSQVRLRSDEEALESLYQNSGYMKFSSSPSLVTVAPNRKHVNISMSINEGRRYHIDKISFSGDLPINESELLKLLTFSSGDVYSRQKITSSIKKISDKLGVNGYAFASINLVPEIDEDANKVSLIFYVEPGKRVYVNQIKISGNTITKDEVIRRELRQIESALYSSDKIKRSKERLDLLGYFSDVNITPEAVENNPDQVNLRVSLVEKQTGSIQMGIGFSQGQGAVLNSSISQNNVFGTGNRLDLKLNGSKVNRTYSLSYVNPYWTTDGVSRSFDLYQRYVDPTSVDLGSYTTETVGTRVRFGVPISEINSIYYGLGYEIQNMRLYENSPVKYYNFVEKFGGKYSTALASLGWSSDTRDSYLVPTSGVYQSLSLEGSLPIADIKYYKLNYQYQMFFPLTDSLTVMANTEFGFAKGYSGNSLPFYLNFYSGGVQSVRGYKSGSLGPRDADNNSLGGDRNVTTNVELFFPLPNMEDDKTLRTSLFFDGGWVYGEDDPLDLGKLRYSTGVALSWISPIGALKISLGLPLNKKEGDKTEVFQFNLGNIF